MAMKDTSLSRPAEGPSGLDAASFFGFAGVDLDPQTFLVEEIDECDAVSTKSPSSYVYSVEGYVTGGRETKEFSMRFYWTIPTPSVGEEISSKSSDLEQILQAFEGKVTSCWIGQCDSDDSSVQRIVYTPEELKTAIGTLKPKEKTEVATPSASTKMINLDAIDETSLKFQIFLDNDGYSFEVFSANLKIQTPTEKEAALMRTASNETIWWRTVNIDRSKNPFGDLSQVWTDEGFQTLIPSLRGEEQTVFLRNLAIRLKHLAMLTARGPHEILFAFRRQDRELPAQRTIRHFSNRTSIDLNRLIYIAGTATFWGVGLSRISWRKITQDILLTGLVKNRLYLRSMMIFGPCVLVLITGVKPILQRIWPLERKSQFVEDLTTLFIGMQSGELFIVAVQEYMIMLLKVPILVSLKMLSTMNAWWRRKGENTRHVLFDGMMEMLLYGKRYGDLKFPFWMDAIILAPVREELIYRFAFDRVWHVLFGGVNSVVAVNSSPLLQPGWVWANSLLFGLVHALNWFPFHIPASSVIDPGNRDEIDHNIWDNILGALLQSAGAILTAFLVFNPLYVRHGLSSSICAHFFLNSIFVGFPLLIRGLLDRLGKVWKGNIGRVIV